MLAPHNASWQIGTPDLIVKSPVVAMKPINPDYWGALAAVPTGLTEDRYVAAMEIKEVNDSRNKPGPPAGAHRRFHRITSGRFKPRSSPPANTSCAASPTTALSQRPKTSPLS
jgi:hypothetical protein